MADTAKHTAGPWTVLGVDCVDGMKFVDIECGDVATKSCRSVSYVRTADGGDTVTEDDMANAHLIAAAPDLLDIAKRSIKYATTAAAYRKDRGWDTSTNEDKFVEDARAAIAKAEGA
jgi:hypothetical protein